ncbi:NAD(+) synthase [Ferrovum sp. PN-J185]|uniref:NAD(+) synthase n=1 Tax=Ferrovum sp. PN-J185 TaxID=1356306 RepID=UPI00079124F2|nr:NAD(+) synthase [Ferrovum sp. PN-J185]KXW56749.1 glutamine-dependent NAD(+) synthetase [Ferrovum sp. PN-J185]MCC6068211.1 NAD(+) synthase [Ferrovum sp. PN-J185]MDE1891317.1 NAD(+) synthase [Betaproteobacteria bacterium]MDE2056157.1 NAD(+) synthase [Betaproteobacteria bacterium]
MIDINSLPYFNLYHHGFFRTAVATPRVYLADPKTNSKEIKTLILNAVSQKVGLVVFPELSLSGYSCDDLFHQQSLIEESLNQLNILIAETADLPIISVVGLPIKNNNKLFNCAAIFSQGKLFGLVPKTYIPNNREFYEARYFTPADPNVVEYLSINNQDIPFGSKIIFSVKNIPDLKIAIEICEDLWVPIPPSSFAALAGATVIANLSASNASVGKAEYRRQLVSNQAARCLSAYVYSAAGVGESTTDLAWDGHGMICDYGLIVNETKRYALESQLITGDIDIQRLVQERIRQNTFAQSQDQFSVEIENFNKINIALSLYGDSVIELINPPLRFPYVPQTVMDRSTRCQEVFEIQVQGLISRIRFTGLSNLIIGVSGGLDSTHALLVAVTAIDRLQLSRKSIKAYGLTGFATREKSIDFFNTLTNQLGVSGEIIDIRPSCMQMLKDLGHPFAEGQPVFDITFENVQAGERSNHLFRLANMQQAMVVGTSDLSELALGWATYGVGDHMAHYHVNASVPKSLMQHLVDWWADHATDNEKLKLTLKKIVQTEISPELIPAEHNGQIQSTEKVIGPYELQDFHLYYLTRFGFSPERVAFMAWCAWHDINSGKWPELTLFEKHTYDIASIKHWLTIFIKRFFEQSQYKRSCIANSPKVGSGGSLSPRGDWRAPSDSKATLWLDKINLIPDTVK